MWYIFLTTIWLFAGVVTCLYCRECFIVSLEKMGSEMYILYFFCIIVPPVAAAGVFMTFIDETPTAIRRLLETFGNWIKETEWRW